MAIPAFAAPKASRSSSSRPPRDLHRVGDHSTAYNAPDPATYPPGAHTYTIKRGDTLWALANQFYKNAYLWPQLWEANTWITDAHWIYPGDVLLVEGEATTTTASTSTSSTSTQTTAEAGSPEVGTTPMPEPMRTTTGNNMVIESRPQPLGTEYDVYCYGYVGDPNEPLPNRINSAEDVETRYETGAVSQDISMSDGDLIFIDGGTSTGIVAGETYLVLEPKDFVNHPRTKAPIGRYNDYRGQVRILCADANRARGIVTKSCREIHVGARLKPLPQIPIPLVRVPPLPAFCDANSNKNRGVIISSLGFDEALGEGNLVTINLGKDDSIQPGDFMVVYRDSPNPGQPRQVLGEIGILTTENHTATAKVVEMRRSMTIGDEVEAR